MSKGHEIKVEVISGPTGVLLEEFERFAALHAAQWEAEGKPGHFGAWPNGLAYNRELVRELAPLNRVRFVLITADGVTIASQFIFAFAGRWYWELPARLPGAEWDRYSLGSHGVVALIGEAIPDGVFWIQAGLGHYEYKLRLGATEHPVVRYRAYSLRLPARLRRAISERIREALRFGYHKIWYRRVTPRLPAVFRRPQWRLWLRWDY